MNYNEQDIDFLKLTDKEFEELCFDLLMRLGYKGLIWRQGGADSGRDIEGRLTVNNSLVDAYEEKWFFECKRYKKGIPPEALYSKIVWADAEKPKHLVIFASSYLSNSARTWLEKIEDEKLYIIHTIEGKQLKKLLLGFPDIINNHFMDDYTKLLVDSQKTWLVHDLLPELESLSLILNNLDVDKLSTDELAFLWIAAKIRTSEIDEWPDTCERFYLDNLFKDIADKHNTSDRLVSLYEDISYDQFAIGFTHWELAYPDYTVARLELNQLTNTRKALYAFVKDKEGEGVEVLIEATGDFPTKVRHITENAKEESDESCQILWKCKHNESKRT